MVIEHARILLGTLVRIRAEHQTEAQAKAAIDGAFDAIAEIHRLMSFHDPLSDLSRLNRAEPGAWTALDPRTAEVLAFALALAERTGGAFDPTVGAKAVAAKSLPRPDGAEPIDPEADWRDVRLAGDAASLTRRLWIDLGGVAKGYAVDRAITYLRDQGAVSGCVDAGGDLRAFGEAPTLIGLRVAQSTAAPILELQDGAAASSGGDPAVSTRHWRAGQVEPLARDRFACVTAPTCMVADALTKVVLAQGTEGAAETLAALGARAYDFSPQAGWRALEPAA